ncbi:hypothetical protein VUR80DRAFT_2413 [Thermomyces stellatus]
MWNPRGEGGVCASAQCMRGREGLVFGSEWVTGPHEVRAVELWLRDHYIAVHHPLGAEDQDPLAEVAGGVHLAAGESLQRGLGAVGQPTYRGNERWSHQPGWLPLAQKPPLTGFRRLPRTRISAAFSCRELFAPQRSFPSGGTTNSAQVVKRGFALCCPKWVTRTPSAGSASSHFSFPPPCVRVSRSEVATSRWYFGLKKLSETWPAWLGLSLSWGLVGFE